MKPENIVTRQFIYERLARNFHELFRDKSGLLSRFICIAVSGVLDIQPGSPAQVRPLLFLDNLRTSTFG